MNSVELNVGSGGAKIGVENIGGVSYELVKQAFGETGTLKTVSESDPLPTSDAQVLNALASIDFSTESTLLLVLAKMIANPATESTLALVLSKLSNDPSTSAKQDVGNTYLSTIAGEDFATEATLSSINNKDFATNNVLQAVLDKIIPSPSTEAKQDTSNALLETLNELVQTQNTLVSSLQPLSSAMNSGQPALRVYPLVGATQPISGSVTVSGAVTVSGTTATSGIAYTSGTQSEMVARNQINILPEIANVSNCTG